MPKDDDNDDDYSMRGELVKYSRFVSLARVKIKIQMSLRGTKKKQTNDV